MGLCKGFPAIRLVRLPSHEFGFPAMVLASQPSACMRPHAQIGEEPSSKARLASVCGNGTTNKNLKTFHIMMQKHTAALAWF